MPADARRPALLAAVLLALTPAGPARADAPEAPAVRALREDASLKVRAQAALVLGQRGGPVAVAALRRAAAEDGAAAVRLAAVSSLGKLAARAARPTLLAAAQADPDPSVRAAARGALQALGPLRLEVEAAAGPPALRGAVQEALAARLGELGFAVGPEGDLRLRPAVEVGGAGGQISVKASVAAVDLDGRVELAEAAARAALPPGAGTDLAARTTARVAQAAARALGDQLADHLGRK